MKEMGFNMVRKHIKIEVGEWQDIFFTSSHKVDRWYFFTFTRQTGGTFSLSLLPGEQVVLLGG